MNLARIHWPDRIVAGDVVKVRLLVQHPMETGYLQDLLGKALYNWYLTAEEAQKLGLVAQVLKTGAPEV